MCLVCAEHAVTASCIWQPGHFAVGRFTRVRAWCMPLALCLASQYGPCAGRCSAELMHVVDVFMGQRLLRSVNESHQLLTSAAGCCVLQVW